MYIHETFWSPVYCFRTPGTLRDIWIGTTHVALVYTHLEATLCRTIAHMWSLAIALAVFQVMFLLFIYLIFFKIIGAATAAPLPTPLIVRKTITFTSSLLDISLKYNLTFQ